MDKSLDIKLKGMFWDLPDKQRKKLLGKILSDPLKAFHDEQLLVRALNSLNWYDLIQILGSDNLIQLLSESAISNLYPPQRQLYYKHAKELLSKYTVSVTG